MLFKCVGPRADVVAMGKWRAVFAESHLRNVEGHAANKTEQSFAYVHLKMGYSWISWIFHLKHPHESESFSKMQSRGLLKAPSEPSACEQRASDLAKLIPRTTLPSSTAHLLTGTSESSSNRSTSIGT